VKKSRYSGGKLKAHYIGLLLCFAFGDISLSPLTWVPNEAYKLGNPPSKCACLQSLQKGDVQDTCLAYLHCWPNQLAPLEVR